ncbi:MAG: NAD(+) synthase [Ruminococcus sp.]|nr:NAD(+) synthase [Ruminococcus sp.]
MKDGFIKIACASPDIRVADCDYNTDKIIEMTKEAHSRGVKIVCFPELSVTGYTCGDLFFQEALGTSAENSLIRIVSETAELEIVSIVGLPLSFMNKIYNCAAVIFKGKILGIVPKENIPNYSEFYEARHFASGKGIDSSTFINGDYVTFGVNQVFECPDLPGLSFGIEICEDLWVADTPSVRHAQNGAVIIFNLSASDETIGKSDYRRTIIQAKSGSLLCAYAYADAGIGESTTDMVFSGHRIIAENGSVLSEALPFSGSGLTIADIDIHRILSERRKCSTFSSDAQSDYAFNAFRLNIEETKLDRRFSPNPFIPSDKKSLDSRCQSILKMQAAGLMTRLRHIGCKNVVLGLSGGLDSTLALIVTVHAFDMLGLDRKGIHAITMPCFGTTDRTYNNACLLAKSYGASLEEINIRDSVNQHFRDISQNPELHDVTYENSQARERTQILMDKANQLGGIVIGTGDLSELALGWATYNGDHMSMYGVNASIPKTLVRWLVSYEAQISDGVLKDVLLDVLDTPVSPELLPPEKDGSIAQKTEDLVGPYELHDFFLYYMMRFGFAPSKIFRISCLAFEDKYSPEIIMKWLKKFYWRFFSQQFKRSCLPDGPKVGSVTLSPRGDWRMPSDASVRIWIKELEDIERTL